ncbi:hemolysin family protein [uncultured Anaerococcus sp.]|uniref:hemolysin family protein n=1 Tax=uncultured Anaerococcus sp. TaxID=293428 RepID=UPI0025F37380|nr:hemolysin family protein [uncultured Anaerococcus sp.]
MDPVPYHSLLGVLIVVILIFINGFFTALHTGLISLSSDKLSDLEEEGSKEAKSLLKISRNQDRLNQSFSMINSIISLVSVAFIADRIRDSEFILENISMKAALIFTILLYIVVKIIFVDKIPQRIGVRNPLGLVLNTTGILRISLALTKPFVLLTELVTDFFMKIFGIEARVVQKEVTNEQIKSIVQIGEDQGIIRPMESKMIHSIMTFDDTIVEEIMTARTDVFMIDINDKDRDFMEEFVKIRHNRIPVYEDNVDNILGVLYTKDYLLEATKVGLYSVDIEKLIRPAHFAPDKIEADKLFSDMQKGHIHMAILIDEYGGFSGVITMEDLIEEIVGDMEDSFDYDIPEIKINNKNVFVVKASIGIKDLNEKIPIGLDEENENYDSLGGFIIDKLGYIPEAGDNETIIFNGYEIKILYMEDNRIKACRIRKLKEDSHEENIEE